MGRNGSGRGRPSASRGRAQNNSSGRIKKSLSPNPKRPAILLTATDSNKLSPHYVAPGGSIATGMTTRSSKQQQLQQQQSGSINPGISTPTIPTSNNFDMLDNSIGDDGEVNNQSLGNTQTQGQGNTPKKRVKSNPPITIVDFPAGNIDKALVDDGCDFQIRVLKTSVKIITFGRPNFEKVLCSLKNANIPYYTHELPEKAAVKVVLTGYNVPCTSEEMLEILAEHKVIPQGAKVLSHTETVTGDHFLWLLYFERGSVKMQNLRKVKSMDGYLVNWRFFSKRPTDAAQCHRCQRFGHGSRYCTLEPKCVKCGAAHLTGECTLPLKADLGKGKNAEQQKDKVKCANCQGNHTANYRGCTTRKSYLEALGKQRRKPEPRQPRTTWTGQPSTASTNPPGFGRTYASVAASGNGPAPDIGASDLFTLTEFLSLARDMFTTLRNCQNKLQQFLALQELMGKYLGTAQV